MINPKSLENLKKPKNKKEKYGHRYSLPQEKIDELFSHLAEGKSLKKAAQETNICFETARKYYLKGDINRGIKPLRFRLTVFQEKLSEKLNVLLEERRMKMLGIIRQTLDKIEDRLLDKVCKCCNGEGIQVNQKTGLKEMCPACKGEGKIVSALMNKTTMKDFERLARLEVFLCGGVTQKETETKILSAEQIADGDNQ